MSKTQSIFFLFILASNVACVSTLNSKKTSSSTTYSEDLSAYLPPAPIDTVVEHTAIEYTVDSALNVATRLDSALQIVNTYNTNKTKYIEGLSIQIYSGNNRSKAKEVQLKAYRNFPDSKPQLIFDQPNYKVRMGAFYSQLEAYPEFKAIQTKFRKAILVPIRIPVSNK